MTSERRAFLRVGADLADIHPAQQRQVIERTLAAETRLSP
jgi:hypothetical protein